MKQDAPVSQNRATLRIFLQHMHRHRTAFGLVFVSVTLATGFDLFQPLLFKRLLDTLATASPKDPHALWVLVGMLAAVRLSSNALYRITDFAQNYGTSKVMTSLINACFRHLLGHSDRFMGNSFVGSLARKVTRFPHAFDQVNDQVAFSLVPSAITMLTIITVLSLKSWWLGVAVLLWSAAFIGVVWRFSHYKQKFDLDRVAADTAVSGHLSDALGNHRTVTACATAPQEERAFEKLTAVLENAMRRTWNLGATSRIFQDLLLSLLKVGGLALGVLLWMKGRFTIGDFALLSAYSDQLDNQLSSVGRYLRTVYEEMSGATEMTKVLIDTHEVTDDPGAVPLEIKAGEIRFQDVRFAYPDGATVFEGLDLLVKPGEKIGLVGPSGSGKSTVMNLLLRFSDLNGGQILIDGQDIAKVTRDSLKRSIAYVPQSPQLFHRTILENIAYGITATREEVIAAAKAANAHGFITVLKNGYESQVGENGVKLSGGQRQRIIIARALLRNAPILILDEATSALDSKSEHLIQEALKRLMEGRTAFVIAHRLSTVQDMDRICVMKEGKIVQQGSHAELLRQTGGEYHQLWGYQGALAA